MYQTRIVRLESGRRSCEAPIGDRGGRRRSPQYGHDLCDARTRDSLAMCDCGLRVHLASIKLALPSAPWWPSAAMWMILNQTSGSATPRRLAD